MNLGSKHLSVGFAALTFAGLAFFGAPGARSQTTKAQKSEEAFKNVQVLKGIPVDDFVGTMGVMSAALGFDCSECHTNAGTDKVDWAADTPRKVTARKMVTMVATINRGNFAGAQMVTCWTCHRGRDRHPGPGCFRGRLGSGSRRFPKAHESLACR